jgi:hypothetical protein
MSEISKQALKVDNTTSFPNNTTGYISPTILRAFNVNMIDSLVEQAGYTANSGSWNLSIGQLNAFTASQQPSFTQLNSFTASQLTINTGVNSFTQSTTGRLNALENDTANLELFTSSINQILVNGSSIGTSTRLFFNGFVSASIVPNVNGAIASITILSDPSLTTTASFNQYTASTAATQLIFSASVATSISQSSNAFNTFSASQNSFNLSATASIVELLNLSSSLSGGYATQGELDYSSSVLQNNINTVSNTLSSFTGSYATTGSNTFVGNQTISSSLFISGNINMVNGADLVTHHVRAAGSNGLELETFAGVTIVAMGQGGGTQAQFVGALSANSFSSSTINGLGNPLTFSQSVDARLDVTATTGSNVFTGSQTITGSLIITGSQTITGSLIITGSAYGNIVSMSVVSNTASMNLSISNFFTLGLTSGQNTRIEPINILPGETINLLISQPSIGSGSISYPSTFKFASGLPYSASLNSSSVDILTFITFDTGSIYAASIKNLR